MTYVIKWEGQKGVYVQYTGIASDRTIAHVECLIQADERFDTLLYELHDFLECDGFAYSLEAVERLAATNYGASFSNSRLVLAVVARSREVVSMFQEYLQFDLGGAPVELFDDIADARAWIANHRYGSRQYLLLRF